MCNVGITTRQTCKKAISLMSHPVEVMGDIYLIKNSVAADVRCGPFCKDGIRSPILEIVMKV